MNIITNGCRGGMSKTMNLVKHCNYLLRRYATTIADYKITWVRPEKVSEFSPEKTGDQGLHIEVKPSDLCTTYKSPELDDASDIVKRMFTLEFSPRNKIMNIKKEKVLDLVQRHELDTTSQEARIAIMTMRIHYLRENLQERPKNTCARVALKELLEKRRKWLTHLRKWDYRRFEWVLDKLNLVYKPLPEKPWEVTRKESLRQLTKKHCQKLMRDKLNAYRKELKELQKDFFKEKAEKLAFIRQEELFYGLKPSVTENDIEIAKQQAEECKI